MSSQSDDFERALREALGDPHLPATVAEALRYNLHHIERSRPAQLAPSGVDFETWIFLAGRGAGKTFAGSNHIGTVGSLYPNLMIGVIAPTANDLRRICFEGPSGLLKQIPASLIDRYVSSKSELYLKNGTAILGYSAEEPERLRGPNFNILYCEELASWKNGGMEAWDMATLALRIPITFQNPDGTIGTRDPYAIIMTTPKPTPLLKKILADPKTVITKGTTLDNDHLPESVKQKLLRRYLGTDLGRQELFAEVLDLGSIAPFAKEKWKFWKKDYLPRVELTILSFDTAYKTGKKNDTTAFVRARVCQAAFRQVYESKTTTSSKLVYKWIVIIDKAWARKMEFPELRRAVIEEHKLASLSNEDDDSDIYVLVEDKASGTSLLQELRRTSVENIIAYAPGHDSKFTRASLASSLFSSDMMYILPADKSRPVVNPEGFAEFRQELAEFAQAVDLFIGDMSYENDDYVDALSQLCQYIRNTRYAPAPEDDRERYLPKPADPDEIDLSEFDDGEFEENVRPYYA